MADVPVSAPQTHVIQLEATIRSAHALLQAGLIREAASLLAAFSPEVQPKVEFLPPQRSESDRQEFNV
ncbi:MAG: hypothetical protein CMA10_07000 [Euryarchaeota archaeon]|nr:hypothetical protein [Euryarchaeota archaeon]